MLVRVVVGHAPFTLVIVMFGRFAKMLVVDDSAVQRKIMRGLLNHLGYDNIDEASDGRAALGLLRKHTYRFVLSDWDMAPMNGMDLLCTMRSDARLKRVPFLLVTAQSQKRFIDIARDAGATHFMTKPFTSAMLAERISMLAATEAA